MKLAIILTVGLALAGCAVEYTQTDLVSLKRVDRTSLREARDVAVVMYPVPALTYNGLRGYPGDEAATLPDLLAAGGALLRQKLMAAADRCSAELVEFFLGAD